MSTYDVVVVGSGISGVLCFNFCFKIRLYWLYRVLGLYAAYLLKKRGLNVLIVEAANYVGGRLKQVRDMCSFMIYLQSFMFIFLAIFLVFLNILLNMVLIVFFSH